MDQMSYIEKLTLVGPSEIRNASLCLSQFASFEKGEELLSLLHPEERKYYETLKSEKRIKNYLIGRFAAKKAIASLIGNENPAQISIQAGIFTQPVVFCENHPNVQVSISHCDNLGVAIAFQETHPMGIDIERVNTERVEAIENEGTEFEMRLLRKLPFAYETMLTLLWTTKETLSKVLRTGLTTPFKIYEIAEIEVREDSFVSIYKNFPQYKALSFTIGQYICTIAHPIKTDLSVNFRALRKTLAIDIDPKPRK